MKQSKTRQMVFAGVLTGMTAALLFLRLGRAIFGRRSDDLES